MRQPDLHPEDKASLLWITAAYVAIAGLASFIIMGISP
jgi:hypothetical protein